jgi:hypothetical protein
VDFGIFEVYPSHANTYYVIHPFGQFMLREIFSHEASVVLKACVELHYGIVKKLNAIFVGQGDKLTHESREVTQAFILTCNGWQFLHNIFIHLRTRPDEYALDEEMRRLFYDYLTGTATTVIVFDFSQIGDSDDDLDFKRIHPYWWELVLGLDVGHTDLREMLVRLNSVIGEIRSRFDHPIHGRPGTSSS